MSCNIAVLDVRVVDGSPLPLIRDLAELVGAGVLVLGPTDEPADRLFDAGAFLLGSSDWSGLHVAARVSTRLRVRPPIESRSTLAWGPLELDPAMHLVWWDGTPLAVTPTEFKILVALMLSKGAVVSKSDLQCQLWGTRTALDDKRLEAHVRRLRSKLGELQRSPFLLTVRGQGYRLADRRVARRAVDGRPSRSVTHRGCLNSGSDNGVGAPHASLILVFQGFSKPRAARERLHDQWVNRRQTVAFS